MSSKQRRRKSMFSAAPVEFRNSAIAGRGVFARRHFAPGDLIVPYAPKQRRVDVADPEAIAAAATKLTLVSEQWFVIIPDTTVPGGWLCNHSCNPNAAIYSDGEGRVQCTRPIAPGAEVTIFYGWVTVGERERDPCRCGAARCRGFINFDVSEAEALTLDEDSEQGAAFRRRLDEYCEFLRGIGQQQVEDSIADKLAQLRAKRC